MLVCVFVCSFGRWFVCLFLCLFAVSGVFLAYEKNVLSEWDRIFFEPFVLCLFACFLSSLLVVCLLVCCLGVFSWMGSVFCLNGAVF